MKKQLFTLFTAALLVFGFGAAEAQAQCTSCDHIVSGNSGTPFRLNNGDTLCITATGFYYGDLNMNNGSVVCNQGSFYPNSVNFNGPTKTLINQPLGKALIPVTTKGTPIIATVYNAGDLTFQGDLESNDLQNITSGSQVAELLVLGSYTNTGSFVNDSGSVEIVNSFTNTIGSTYEALNESFLRVENLINSGTITNPNPPYSQIYVANYADNDGDITGFVDVCKGGTSSNAGNTFDVQTGTIGPSVTYCTNNSPLPVEFLSFSASAEGGAVVLNWETASEENNHYFEVQRMVSNGEFTTVGKVAGAGSSQQILSYQFVDETAPAGNTLYYRLRQVDYNGEYDFSTVAAIEQNKANVGTVASIYPNPVNANSQLNIRLKGEQTQEVPYVLLNMNQQVLQEGTVTSTGVVSTEDLKPGMYLLQIRHSAAPEVLKVVVK